MADEKEPIGTPVADHVTVEFKGEAPLGREFISVRNISKADLAAIHVDAPGDLSWSALNGWKQDVPNEYADLIAYFRRDKGFTVHSV